ncbi:hypothetical protein BDV29DRAFT_161169 [Aspergillus leporis]|uniref:Uncharacterized protein n=1 Tax=Aspergillus leporis TaxID=41062 RepID=A0A5N5WMB5_9EURO|nr:hypothetical protein BDV29DRAFT_161169 [Aspergillus leporis]
MPSKKAKKKARNNNARQQKANDTLNTQDGLPFDQSVTGDNPDKGEAEDEDMGDPPPTTPLGRPQAGDWVIDIIRKFTKDRGNDVMNKLFLTDNPNFKEVHAFFNEVNDNIRAANMAHGIENVRVGEIPAQTYEAMYQSWKMQLAKPEIQNNPVEAWNAYDKVYQALENFNQEYNLPLRWNISASAAEQAFGPRPALGMPLASVPKGEQSDSEGSEDEDSESDSEAEVQSDDDYAPSAIDLLEARARKQGRSLTGAKVLFWWSKGTGTQIFVRYGSKSKPIFRVRAGSYEYYDKKRVTRVLLSQNRGYMKKPEVTDGILGETWKYSRKDVSNILGVGWKVEDDDENGIDPLELIIPQPGAVYPETRILVEWRDGEKTLENRSFIRRIANGSYLDGYRLVFQKAKELEEAYREDNTIADLGEDEEDELIEEEEEVEQGPSVRGKSPPRSVVSAARSRQSGKSSVRFEDGVDGDSVSSGRTVMTRASKKSNIRPIVSSRDEKRQPLLVYEDDRDHEIRRLREQVNQLSMNPPWQQTKVIQRQPISQNGFLPMSNMSNAGFDDRASTVSSKPPIRPLRRGRRRGRAYVQEPWNYWADGHWNHNMNPYY